jgi:hypothetical protein
MRLVTWNCFRGECLARAADLSDLGADLLVLQECARPTASSPGQAAWFGSNPRHGLGVVAANGYRVRALDVATGVADSVYPVRVEGAHCFDVLAVWAKATPTYLDAIAHGLDAYHAAPHRAPASDESPTHFWRWRADMGFHIDYCFVPESWLEGLTADVLGEPAGSRRSDHRPLVVDVAPVGTTAAVAAV